MVVGQVPPICLVKVFDLLTDMGTSTQVRETRHSTSSKAPPVLCKASWDIVPKYGAVMIS